MGSTPGNSTARSTVFQDEMYAAWAAGSAEAEAAWLEYRDAYSRSNLLSSRQAASRMRRREFIAGFMAARVG